MEKFVITRRIKIYMLFIIFILKSCVAKTFLRCLELSCVCYVYFIKVCKQQTYGVACSQACGYCSNGEACHPANGTCVNGCMEGVMGSNCKIGELKWEEQIYVWK